MGFVQRRYGRYMQREQEYIPLAGETGPVPRDASVPLCSCDVISLKRYASQAPERCRA